MFDQIGEWDWRTIASVASLSVGGIALALSIIVHRWTRKESRLQALSGVLRPFVEAMQKVKDACNCRRTCEEIKRAYPEPQKAPDAVEQVNAKIREYCSLSGQAAEQFKAMERELGACQFRFPEKVGRTLHAALQDLSAAGQYLNEGSLDLVDVQIAKCKDQHRWVTKYARGWRLAAPFEAVVGLVRRTFSRKEPEPASRFDLTQQRMERILQLVHRRATTQAHCPFVVHPPRKVLDNPLICQADDVVEELEDAIFEVVFQDGTYEMMTLVEVMVFTYQLILLEHQMMEVSKFYAVAGDKSFEVSVKMSFSERDIMRPEMVRVLLSKIKFSDSPSDAPLASPSPRASDG